MSFCTNVSDGWRFSVPPSAPKGSSGPRAAQAISVDEPASQRHDSWKLPFSFKLFCNILDARTLM